LEKVPWQQLQVPPWKAIKGIWKWMSCSLVNLSAAIFEGSWRECNGIWQLNHEGSPLETSGQPCREGQQIQDGTSAQGLNAHWTDPGPALWGILPPISGFHTPIGFKQWWFEVRANGGIGD